MVNNIFVVKCYLLLMLVMFLSSCSTITDQIVAKNCKPFVDSKEYYLCDKVDE